MWLGRGGGGEREVGGGGGRGDGGIKFHPVTESVFEPAPSSSSA